MSRRLLKLATWICLVAIFALSLSHGTLAPAVFDPALGAGEPWTFSTACVVDAAWPELSPLLSTAAPRGPPHS